MPVRSAKSLILCSISEVVGKGRQVVVEGHLHRLAGLLVHRIAAVHDGEPAVEVLDGGLQVQQRHPGVQPGELQHPVQHAGRGLQGQRADRVVPAGRDAVQLGEVGVGELGHQVGDDVVRQRLGVPDERDAGREPPQVPDVRADVGLVEVVDVEHQYARGVHVGAEVLGVQVAVDPDTPRLLVQEGVVGELAGHVRVGRLQLVGCERRPQHLGGDLRRRLHPLRCRRERLRVAGCGAGGAMARAPWTRPGQFCSRPFAPPTSRRPRAYGRERGDPDRSDV